jgi:spore germination protein GerM
MNKKAIIAIIIIIAVALAGIVLIRMASRFTEDSATEQVPETPKEIAESWIIDNSSTYGFDGFDLELISEKKVVGEEAYSVTFFFNSNAAGYGDRADEMAAQVITPHLIEVVVKNGEVVSAVTDGVYDEMKGEMIEGTNPETTEIKLYFVKVTEGQEEIVETERSIPYTAATARAAITELLKGPLAEEEAEGLSTAINEGVELQNISIEDGTAFVDFSEELEENVAGSAWVTAIREQIEKTLMQFDTVNQVVISVNGRTEDILQP